MTSGFLTGVQQEYIDWAPLADSPKPIRRSFPDGLVGETDIVEVKGPFRWKDHTVELSVQEKSFYLHQEDGTLEQGR